MVVVSALQRLVLGQGNQDGHQVGVEWSPVLALASRL